MLWPIARDLLQVRSGQGLSISHDLYYQPAAGWTLSDASRGESQTVPPAAWKGNEETARSLTADSEPALAVDDHFFPSCAQ